MENFSSSGNWNSQDLKSITILKNENFSFYWKIERFGEFMDRKYEFSSSSFSSKLNEDFKWKMTAYPQDVYPEGQHLCLRLIKASNDNKSVSIKYEIAIIDRNDKYILQKIRENIFRNYSDYDECIIVSNRELEKKNLLYNDVLTICCKMDLLVSENPSDQNDVSVTNNLSTLSFYEQPLQKEHKIINLQNFSTTVFGSSGQNNTFQNENYKTNNSLECLSGDFKNLYLNKHEWDVIIRVDDGEIRAHKAVIASRSNFFKRSIMSGNSEITIAGMKSAILDVILNYIYTGKLAQLTFELAIDVLKACNIFNLSQLEDLIQNFLKMQIDANNVTDVLQIAISLGLSDLKTCTLKYVATNHLEVTKTEKWSQMMKNNPHAAGEVLLAIASFQNPNKKNYKY